jgi:DNA-binding response OmpR family regulator
MFSRPTILCIEDENDLRSDIVEELTDAGYTARQAANGIEAVKLLERERPDLVLCDITMPGLSGYGVLRAMREKGSLADVPFIFITALGDRNDLLVGKQAGANDYLVKPLDYDLLLATVAARLNQVDRVRKEAVRRRRRRGASSSKPRAAGRSIPCAARRRPSTAFSSAWWSSIRPEKYAS